MYKHVIKLTIAQINIISTPSHDDSHLDPISTCRSRVSPHAERKSSH